MPQNRLYNLRIDEDVVEAIPYVQIQDLQLLADTEICYVEEGHMFRRAWDYEELRPYLSPIRLYYAKENNQIYGAFSLELIREQNLPENTLISCLQNGGGFIEARCYAELQGYLLPIAKDESKDSISGLNDVTSHRFIADDIKENSILTGLSEEFMPSVQIDNEELLQMMRNYYEEQAIYLESLFTDYGLDQDEMGCSHWRYLPLEQQLSLSLELRRKLEQRIKRLMVELVPFATKLDLKHLQYQTNLIMSCGIDPDFVLEAKLEEEKYYSEMRRKISNSLRNYLQLCQIPQEYIDMHLSCSSFHSLAWTQSLMLEKIHSPLLLGTLQSEWSILGENYSLLEGFYIDVLFCKHLRILGSSPMYTRESVVLSLLSRIYLKSGIQRMKAVVIDCDDWGGLHPIFKTLPGSCHKLITRSEEAKQEMDHLLRYAEDTIHHRFSSNVVDIQSYNKTHESQLPIQLLILKSYTSSDLTPILSRLIQHGLRVGIHIIDLRTDFPVRELSQWEELWNSSHCETINISKLEPVELQLNIIPDNILNELASLLEACYKVQESSQVNFLDYVPENHKWWKCNSARQLSVPIGVQDEGRVESLRITQEAGQNTVLVIGVPGSGKSVFLHTFILNASICYSPDELALYLIDFSGVEFNIYAEKNLPQARVIAPEAEREFGLSILNEIIEEGSRRMALCREHRVNSIVDLRESDPSIVVPRIVVVIDEFQKIFEIENDPISREANSRIQTIIKEFRKFGISLILATQRLPSGVILDSSLVGNRIVFKSAAQDLSVLTGITGRIPEMKTGSCVYNSTGGDPSSNRLLQSFLTTGADKENVLESLQILLQRELPPKREIRVFRSDEQPELFNRRQLPQHIPSELPNELGLYLGESIAIQPYDTHAVLRRETGNNVIIVGGDADVSERIALNLSLSAMDAHTDGSAEFYVCNLWRNLDNPRADIAHSLFANTPFVCHIGTSEEERIQDILSLRQELETRRQDDEKSLRHIYLFIYGFQYGRLFERGGRRGTDLSEASAALDYILANGSQYGIFTILQVDQFSSIRTCLDSNERFFAHRVLLQMDETESNRLMGSAAASRLFVFNRPSSRYRAYYYDVRKGVTIKFKPYK